MFARVYNKEYDKFYKSIVYGTINSGYFEKSIFFNPFTESFELVDYFDENKKYFKPLYEIINPSKENWVYYNGNDLLNFKSYCKEYGYTEEIQLFCGYDDVFKNFSFILRLLQDKIIKLKDSNVKIRYNEDINKWNYIKTQEDANSMMHLLFGFHDSVIEKALYEEDNFHRTITITLDNSGWYGIVELCFEGVIAMNLRPSPVNFSREIYYGCLLVKDECIYWADDSLKEEDMNYQGTFIKALNLKWRKL